MQQMLQQAHINNTAKEQELQVAVTKLSQYKKERSFVREHVLSTRSKALELLKTTRQIREQLGSVKQMVQAEGIHGFM